MSLKLINNNAKNKDLSFVYSKFFQEKNQNNFCFKRRKSLNIEKCLLLNQFKIAKLNCFKPAFTNNSPETCSKYQIL
jgi:hypothetical protein